jgi:hypothetical protein
MDTRVGAVSCWQKFSSAKCNQHFTGAQIKLRHSAMKSDTPQKYVSDKLHTLLRDMTSTGNLLHSLKYKNSVS